MYRIRQGIYRAKLGNTTSRSCAILADLRDNSHIPDMRARPSVIPALALFVVLAHGTQTSRPLSVAVLDENGVAVRGAHVTLQPSSPTQALRCETEISGRCQLPQIPSGPCQIHVENEGYYAAHSSDDPSASSDITIALTH